MKKLVFLMVLFLPIGMLAQTMINEGKIVYDIFIMNDLKEVKGQLIITVKNGILKREMTMTTGFNNIIIYNSTAAESWSYNNMNGNKFAKKMSKEELASQNVGFNNASYIPQAEEKTILEKACKKVEITYKNGTSNNVYYSADWKCGIKEFYTMFPEINGLPLQYEVATSGNNKMILIAKSVQIIPIDNAEVEAPKGYKIIQ
jgi:hypothetical protein